jgi:putative transposase
LGSDPGSWICANSVKRPLSCGVATYVLGVARKPRIDVPDALHHITALANGEERLFREPADRRRFLQQLRTVAIDEDWRCQAYCLMGTHFHLIVYTPRATLSGGMRRLLGTYAQWFNWKYDRRGHLFVGRFSSQHITEDPHLMEAHRYVALNPVRAEQCKDPADWRGGSYRALAGFEPPVDFLDVHAVHELFSLRSEAAQRAYKAFVLSGAEGWGQTPSGSDPFGDNPERRGWDLNPRCPAKGTAVFKTAPFDRSGTPPTP